MDEKKRAPAHESFVEESEDTQAQLSSSDSSTLTDVSGSDVDDDASVTKHENAPFSLDSFLNGNNFGKQDTSSSDESRSTSSILRKSESSSDSDSESLSESSVKSIPISTAPSEKPRAKLEKQFSKVIPLSVIESVNQISSPSLVTAEVSTIPDENNDSLKVNIKAKKFWQFTVFLLVW